MSEMKLRLSAAGYLESIRVLREKAQAESALEAEICSAVIFLLRRERDRELAILTASKGLTTHLRQHSDDQPSKAKQGDDAPQVG